MDGIEKILRLAADSERMGPFDDGLSGLIKDTEARYVGAELSDDELELAAGGRGPAQLNMNESNIKKILEKIDENGDSAL